MLIRRQLHLAAPVRGPDPRALHTNPPATERDRPVLVAVTDRRAVGIVMALRANDIVDLRLHQLVQHPEPDTDAQRE